MNAVAAASSRCGAHLRVFAPHANATWELSSFSRAQSQLALACDRKTDAGLKESAKLFQVGWAGSTGVKAGGRPPLLGCS